MLFNLWVTSKCNMRCKYCYEKNRTDYMNMERDTAKQIVEYISHYEKQEEIIVNFHGGEPLIAFDIIEYLVKELRKRLLGAKLYFGVTTNGILLNEQIIDFLCDNFYFSLSVSIDGKKKVHDRNRVMLNGQGTHDIIMENIHKLIVRRKDVRARVTFTSDTVKCLYETVEYLYELGFRVIIPIADYFDDRWNTESMEVFKEQLSKIYDKYKDIGKNNLDIGLMRDNHSRMKNGKCDPLNCSVNIDYKGNLFPCSYVVDDNNYKVGDIYTGMIDSKLLEIYELSTIKNKSCIGCKNYDYCISTRCKIVNKMLTGDYHQASPVYCNIENVIYTVSKKYNYQALYS